MRGSTIPVYHCAFGCLCLHSSRAICGRLPENFCTTTLVLRHLVLQTHRDKQERQRNVRGAGWDPQRAGRSRKGPPTADYPARTAHHRLKPMKHHLTPMKHHLTLDQVKKEAIDLLGGLQRRDPEALRRCHAVDLFTDKSRPALDYARIIIAREHGFS